MIAPIIPEAVKQSDVNFYDVYLATDSEDSRTYFKLYREISAEAIEYILEHPYAIAKYLIDKHTSALPR